MAFRASSMAIAAAALAAAFGCAGRHGAAPEASGPSAAGSSASAPAPATARLTQAAFNEDSDGARVVLSADAPLLYTSYEPRPGLIVFDFPAVEVGEGFTTPKPTGDLISEIKVEPITELGKRITRLTIAHREGVSYQAGSIGEGLAIAFSVPGAPASDPEPVVATAALAEPVKPPAPRVSAPPPLGELAHSLEDVTAQTRDGSVQISLLGDGVFAPKNFVLANPPRLVIDLPGVRNEFAHRVVPVKSDLVSRVRVSQFQTVPEMVTRVVVDLTRPAPHVLESDGERLAVRIGAAAGGDRPEPASVTRIAESAPIASGPVAAPVSEESEPAAAGTAKPEHPGTSLAAAEKSDPAAAATIAAPESTRIETVVASPSVSPPASQSPRAPNAARDEALFEAAAAMLAQEEARPEPLTSAYQSRTLAETQSQFTGEPISLDLKDADIKDVFRTISQLTGLNIVIDPEVRGTVTVQLEDVPWDQALDLILKQNGLGYVLENNIMRIATTQKLQAEQADRLRLAEARQAAEPTRTVIKKLSYASAQEITPVLKSVMSRRGDIVVDVRTNTLIIREIPTFLPAVLQLIENLDTSTPQVMIESRIVETTKTLGRSLGINWGFDGVADVAHGNTTGLIFPNSLDGFFDVNLPAGPTVAALRLGNILDTFNLDIALTAAENQGLLKIISSPKVTALTNTAALIQSGVQIPVQTTVNNTTTVIYVDATLRLQVTPQITAEGTILMNVAVQKREPAVALNLALGQNVPLRIQEYRGQILVRDGGTTVIGGIFQINDQDQNNMIPGLWKIPILGNLFRNKTTTLKHDEMLIFITPRILRS